MLIWGLFRYTAYSTSVYHDKRLCISLILFVYALSCFYKLDWRTYENKFEKSYENWKILWKLTKLMSVKKHK